jgi:hypothetical protein
MSLEMRSNALAHQFENSRSETPIDPRLWRRLSSEQPGRLSYRRQRNFSADVPEFTFTSTSKVENKAPSLAIARMR